MSQYSDDVLSGLAYRIGIWQQLCDGYDTTSRHILANNIKISFADKFLDDIYLLLELVDEGEQLRFQQALTQELQRQAKISNDFSARLA